MEVLPTGCSVDSNFTINMQAKAMRVGVLCYKKFYLKQQYKCICFIRMRSLSTVTNDPKSLKKKHELVLGMVCLEGGCGQ
jgi:hypothetical protein